MSETPAIPEGVERPKRTNRFPIKKEDVDEHGVSEDCPGCLHQAIGASQRGHTPACRERFEKIFMEAGDERVLKELDRLDEQREIARRRAEPVAAPVRKEDEDEEMKEEHDSDAESEDEDEDMVLKQGELMRISYDSDMEERLIEMSKQAGKKRTDWKSDVAKMNKALERENIGSAITEIYSPPRINAIAEMWKLLPGWSLDLTTVDPEDGQTWDFTKQDKRDKDERSTSVHCEGRHVQIQHETERE